MVTMVWCLIMLYDACHIAPIELDGHATSKYIVAVNKDADAPIFQHADYGIVATWEEALPVLQSTLSAMMA